MKRVEKPLSRVFRSWEECSCCRDTDARSPIAAISRRSERRHAEYRALPRTASCCRRTNSLCSHVCPTFENVSAATRAGIFLEGISASADWRLSNRQRARRTRPALFRAYIAVFRVYIAPGPRECERRDLTRERKRGRHRERAVREAERQRARDRDRGSGEENKSRTTTTRGRRGEERDACEQGILSSSAYSLTCDSWPCLAW